MGKSIYEEYAEKRQKELLNENRSLQQSIELLKKNKEIFSKEYLENQIDFVASLFDLIPEEVKRAIDGKEYWCL